MLLPSLSVGPDPAIIKTSGEFPFEGTSKVPSIFPVGVSNTIISS